MKKFLSLLMVLLLCLCSVAQADEARIIDDANLFSADEEAALYGLIADFQNETGMDFVIYTSDDYHTETQAAIADDLYDDGGYGLDEDASGVLYFIDMYERIPYLSTTGAMIDYMTDARINAAHESAYDFLASGQYADAAAQMIYAVYGYWEKGIPEGQYRYDIVTGQRLTARHKALTGSELLVCALIGLVAALLFIKSVQGSYTLKGSTYHYSFRENSEMGDIDSDDQFLRTTTTRTRKVQPPSGSSGSRSGGSGVHRSSSGRSHGGGAGRKF